ncbi:MULTISPECIES: type I restriction-modification system subunit M N-terminal domain-containing protein [unclassified Saccharicrinis]|uniref:type I restriction-modification system subunit M N-terminal domain-containing protein n=1 Tax=unclassified Saccharicrinis TaxID=2646859 RepID=UPI003D346A49
MMIAYILPNGAKINKSKNGLNPPLALEILLRNSTTSQQGASLSCINSPERCCVSFRQLLVLSYFKCSLHLAKIAWILKGPVDALDFKVYIFTLLFFKRLSNVYDEEYQQALEESDGDAEYASWPEFHRFETPEGAIGKMYVKHNQCCFSY